MIQRLKKLRVENFRAYGGSPLDIDLDANVVLIHGRNGSGKTSLLSAIECALTGEVAHLANYTKDYPGVLSHKLFGSDKPSRAGRVSVEMVTGSAEQTEDRVIERTVGENGVRLTGGTELDDTVIDSFVDRCYLSQHQLSRLLSAYQSGKSKKRGDTPIVRFIREFLELEDFESVEEGLGLTSDIRKLKKAFPQYEALEAEHASIGSSVDALRTDLNAATVAEDEARKRLLTLTSEAAVNVEDPLALGELEADIRGQIEELRSDETRLGRIAEMLGASAVRPPPEPGEVDVAPALRVFREVEEAVAQARETVGLPELPGGTVPSLTADSGAPGALEVRSVVDDWLYQVEAVEKAVRAQVAETRSAIAEAVEAAEEITLIRESLSEIRSAEEALGQATGDMVSQAQDLRSALAGILPHVDGDDCPVCNRDFGEVGGDLRGYLVSRLESLGVVATQLEEQATRRAELDQERSNREARISAIEPKASTDKLAAARTRLANLEPVPARLLQAKTDLGALSNVVEQLEERAQRIARRATWRAGAEAVLDSLREIASSSGNPLTVAPDGTLDSEALASVRQLVDNRLGALPSRISGLDKIVAQVSTLRARASEATKVRDRLAAEEARKVLVDRTYERASSLHKAASKLRLSAANTTKDLIESTFDEQLNVLVDDIYMRLVRDEQFRPGISAKRSGRIVSAAINAFVTTRGRGQKKAAEDLSSLVSTANVNTAALSLFLALHLAAPSRPRTIILDDPVQSMDDVHASNFAALLRSLAYQSKDPRQLVLAIHDRALFEYLALELSPTKEGDTIIEVQVRRESPNEVTVQQQRRGWIPDRIELGLAS